MIEVNMDEQIAIFAAGCFWGVEATYRQVAGVIKTEVGYTGGTKKNPTYKDVGTGKTGHAESLRVTFNPSVVSYENLVDLFFKSHDSTTLNRQGPDVGTQYRSAIFYTSEEQKANAERIKEKYQQSAGLKGKRIVTEIRPAGEFYLAEDYHQQYFEKYGFHPCVNFLPLPAKAGTLSKLEV